MRKRLQAIRSLLLDHAPGKDVFSCALEALRDSDRLTRAAVWKALYTQIPGGDKSLVTWSSRSKVTHADVVALVDRATAALGKVAA